MESKDIKHSVLLCKKCLEKGEYTIPLYDKNELTQEIECKCPKHKNVKNDTIYMEIDEALKIKLTCCENHIENNFCGWSEKESKNLCFMEIGEHLTDKKNYELFIDIYPDTQLKEDMYFETIDLLKFLLKKYLAEFPSAIKEINYLKEVVTITENSLCIFLKEKIVNYQTIKNTSFSIKIMPSKIEIKSLIKQLLVYIYGDLITETTKKEVSNIDIKELVLDFDMLAKKNNSDEKNIKIIPYIEEKNQIFLAYNKIENIHNILIYKIIENHIVKIHNLQKKFEFAMIYNEKLIILLERDILYFVSFSDNNLENKIFNISMRNFLNNNNNNNDLFDDMLQFHDNHNFNDYHLFGKYFQYTFYENQLIKINQNKILLLYINWPYLITLNDKLNSISKFIRIDGLLMGRKKASIIYYRDNNIIKKGIIIATFFKEENNKNKSMPGLFLEINIYNNNMELIKIFDISIPIIKNFDKKNISEIHNNFLNDRLLIFIDQKIYQINLETRTLETIYDISLYNEAKIRIFYNYDERKKMIEQVILIMNEKEGKIYLFNWEDKMIKCKKEYEYKDIIDFIPLYTPEIFNLLNEDTDIKFEKIFFRLNKGILYN